MVQDWYLETERDKKKCEKGRCPLCRDKEDALLILLKCLGMRK
jgi:hypothetical protein